LQSLFLPYVAIFLFCHTDPVEVQNKKDFHSCQGYEGFVLNVGKLGFLHI